MSTRGFLGFVIDGEEKIAYNHFDSYPDALGLDVLYWLRTEEKHGAEEAARKLRVVKESDPLPDGDELLRLARYTDAHVGGHGIKNEVVHDWYQLLRKTQGNPAAILDAGYVEDASAFPLDSLFCEWGYLVDFDKRRLEVYKGFVIEPTKEGRWAGREGKPGPLGSTYYPVELVASWSFDHLPTDGDFLVATASGDE